MSKKTDDWMPLHIGVYLRDTPHLTREQHGAYLLLLMAYWTKGGPLPADDVQLAAIVKATPAEWRKKLRPIIAPFFTERDGLWHQKRAEAELATARELTESRSRAGKAGAESRWQNDGKRMAEPLANDIANEKQTAWQNDGPLPSTNYPVQNKKKEALEILSGKGKKNGARTTIADPQERLARFQASIARHLGREGWPIVAAAVDPNDPCHEASLAVCKKAANEMGKGWPHTWT